jgi:hypothetical protein
MAPSASGWCGRGMPAVMRTRSPPHSPSAAHRSTDRCSDGVKRDSDLLNSRSLRERACGVSRTVAFRDQTGLPPSPCRCNPPLAVSVRRRGVALSRESADGNPVCDCRTSSSAQRCRRSSRRRNRSHSRSWRHSPPLSAFRATRAFPSEVRGPVDRSHGHQRLIASRCLRDHTPCRHWQTHTVVAALCLDGNI